MYLPTFPTKYVALHRIKSRIWIRLLRQVTLHLDLMNACLKFERVMWIIGLNSHEKNKMFFFANHYFTEFLTQIRLNYISM